MAVYGRDNRLVFAVARPETLAQTPKGLSDVKRTRGIVIAAGVAAALAWSTTAVAVASPAASIADRAASHRAEVAPRPQAAAPASWNDFDGDGRADLVVGVPNDKIAGVSNAGAVHVFYGASTGLAGNRSERWHENRAREGGGTIGQAEDGDRFGSGLAAGDFNGFGDLAIGVPGEDVTISTVNHPDRGAVHILWGSVDGLRASTPTAIQGGEDNGRLGQALAALDYYGADAQHGRDGVADLAIGVPGSIFGNVPGKFLVIRVGSTMFPAINPDPIETYPCVSTTTVKFVNCGEVFAVGELDTVGGDDLAVGVPKTMVGPDGSEKVYAGAVVMLRQGALSTLTQESAGVPGSSDDFDKFGQAVAIGELYGPHAGDEILIGVPGKDIVVGSSTAEQAGRVIFGLGGNHFTGLDESSADVPDTAETTDAFGSALAIADVGGSADAEIIIGVPGEMVGGQDAAGAVDVLYATLPDQRWTQSSPSVQGTAAFADAFGGRLTAGNYGLGTKRDVAIGILSEPAGDASFPGGVAVLYGSPANGLTADNDQLFTQATAGVDGNPDKGEGFGSSLR
ncbi:MAG: hypothetical protein QOH61_2237 [Chloroflexota bacterium]|jgi:hypothetical protein|nr:hypothetical protein [Chloroflexota bacterium]